MDFGVHRTLLPTKVQHWSEEKGRVCWPCCSQVAGFEAELPGKVPSKIQFWTERKAQLWLEEKIQQMIFQDGKL
jgi:hypothetical protein